MREVAPLPLLPLSLPLSRGYSQAILPLAFQAWPGRL